MAEFRPPDLTDQHRRTSASQRRAPRPVGPKRPAVWPRLLRAANRWLADHPEVPLCLGLLLVAATLTVLREGSLGDYRTGPYWYRTSHPVPSQDGVRWLRFAGAAAVVLGIYYRLRYKR